jgi:hypothetical protein
MNVLLVNESRLRRTDKIGCVFIVKRGVLIGNTGNLIDVQI